MYKLLYTIDNSNSNTQKEIVCLAIVMLKSKWHMYICWDSCSYCCLFKTFLLLSLRFSLSLSPSSTSVQLLLPYLTQFLNSSLILTSQSMSFTACPSAQVLRLYLCLKVRHGSIGWVKVRHGSIGWVKVRHGSIGWVKVRHGSIGWVKVRHVSIGWVKVRHGSIGWVKVRHGSIGWCWKIHIYNVQ